MSSVRPYRAYAVIPPHMTPPPTPHTQRSMWTLFNDMPTAIFAPLLRQFHRAQRNIIIGKTTRHFRRKGSSPPVWNCFGKTLPFSVEVHHLLAFEYTFWRGFHVFLRKIRRYGSTVYFRSVFWSYVIQLDQDLLMREQVGWCAAAFDSCLAPSRTERLMGVYKKNKQKTKIFLTYTILGKHTKWRIYLE